SAAGVVSRRRESVMLDEGWPFGVAPTFPQRSPPLLLATAACGGLRSTPDCRPRRTFLHLSYSYAAPCGPALLVTQCQEQTCRRARLCEGSGQPDIHRVIKLP